MMKLYNLKNYKNYRIKKRKVKRIILKDINKKF